jgi:hypothetical protein
MIEPFFKKHTAMDKVFQIGKSMVVAINKQLVKVCVALD